MPRSVETADGQGIAARFFHPEGEPKRIAPCDVGARRIGHFGFFRSALEVSLWRAHLLPELA